MLPAVTPTPLSPADAIVSRLCADIRIAPQQVLAAIALIDGGATVPFIARYRKEATGGLDDIQLRELEARLAYLRELQDRLKTVIKAIDEQGKLTPVLLAALQAADSKQALEDLYLPFKLKRRTKGQLAVEAGLLPLADALLADPGLLPSDAAQAYVIPFKPALPGEDIVPDFSTVPAVLDGVRDILSERWAQDPSVVVPLRDWLWDQGLLKSTRVDSQPESNPEVAKFRDYFDYDEPIGRVPSHRALAVFRGRALGFLDAKLVLPPSNSALALTGIAQSAIKPVASSGAAKGPEVTLAEARIALALKWRHQNRPADDLIRKCVAWTWRVKLSLAIERDLFTRLRDGAEKVAIKVFADNLRDLLLAAPAGPRVVMGLDPGIRTGVKVAVVDATGKLVDTATVFPHEPRRDWDGAQHQLAALCQKHGVNLIAIGNGTASRETDKLAGEMMKRLATSAGPLAQKIDKVVVSEAGASVYSASEFASQEMPDVDVSLRGAASIARRLQDPLAELVKIDPKSIGVGQYQHDLNQSELQKSLDATVEDCVNRVGVDLNTASVPLLARVSGLSGGLAKAVVRWREANGAFKNRRQLLDVTGLGAKTYEQSAGFLRIRGGDNPLDMTGVHPETYPLVERIMARVAGGAGMATGAAADAAGRAQALASVLGRAEVFKALRPEMFADGQFGAITVKDVLTDLEKPGRDPRPDFKVAQLNDAVKDVADLVPGMVLEGTVSNVAAFGAFVDLGVHQDGLVHVSQLADKFVQDAREVVKTGDIVRVTVLEVDLARKRIALSMRRGARPPDASPASNSQGRAPARQGTPAPAFTGAMASAFAKLNT